MNDEEDEQEKDKEEEAGEKEEEKTDKGKAAETAMTQRHRHSEHSECVAYPSIFFPGRKQKLIHYFEHEHLLRCHKYSFPNC